MKIPLSRYKVCKIKDKKEYSTELCVAKVIVRGKNPLDEPEIKYGWVWKDAYDITKIKPNALFDDANVAQGLLDTWADDHYYRYSNKNKRIPVVDYMPHQRMVLERTPLYN